MTENIKKIFPIIKNHLKNAGSFLLNNKYIIYIAVLFYLMDIFTRWFGTKITFYPVYYPAPNLFSLIWIVLIIGIIMSLKGIWSKIAYWIFFSLFFLLFLTNCIYYSLTGIFFSFNLLLLADEGSSYILDTMLNTNPLIYVVAIVFIALAVITFRKLPKNDKFSVKPILITFVLFIVGHLIIPFTLGTANDGLKWNTFKNARNIYNDFTDFNKSMKVSGLFEYSARNFYINFLKPKETISAEDKYFLDDCYNAEDTKTDNRYTGLFEGKNLIFLQLEGMDEWLLTKETTPNLYSLKEHSIDFKNHFSLYTGGGSTFNSEFAVNTGFTTPISYIENVYSFSSNTFDYSMPKLFKKQGYTVNAFHMNSGDFYSRDINYKNWGYDNYYGLADIQDYSNNEHELDRELIENEEFYDLMFKGSQPFVNYIISYSPHKPFNTDVEVGEMLAEMNYGDNIPDMSEEEVARMMVAETDYMVGLLIQALKDNGLYDNTVIVAYADHYLYTLDDKSALEKYKETQNNLINRTPFFIWSSDINKREIKDTTIQMNILPTVLNLFGIDYNSNNYLMKDALSNDYEGFAFFPDYSWYDGNVYVENGAITNGGYITDEELQKKNAMIGEIIRKNDLTLKYDYFK